MGTQTESQSREWKDRSKRGRSALGKSGAQSEDVMGSELISSEAGELAVEKSRYCVYCTRKFVHLGAIELVPQGKDERLIKSKNKQRLNLVPFA